MCVNVCACVRVCVHVCICVCTCVHVCVQYDQPLQKICIPQYTTEDQLSLFKNPYDKCIADIVIETEIHIMGVTNSHLINAEELGILGDTFWLLDTSMQI